MTNVVSSESVPVVSQRFGSQSLVEARCSSEKSARTASVTVTVAPGARVPRSQLALA